MKTYVARFTSSAIQTAVLFAVTAASAAVAQQDDTAYKPRPIVLAKPINLAADRRINAEVNAALLHPTGAPATRPAPEASPTTIATASALTAGPVAAPPVASSPAAPSPNAAALRRISLAAASPVGNSVVATNTVETSNAGSAYTGTSNPGSGDVGTATGGAAMMRNFDDSAPAEQTLHVMVGRSIFVDTRHRLTRVYVTDPTVLNSYTSSPNQIVVTAIKAGQSTVIVWDEAGDSKAYIISADTDVDALRIAMKEAFPAESIQVQGDQQRALLTGFIGTEAAGEAAVKLASQYAKEVSDSLIVNSSRVKQVRLKVRIVEIDRSKLAQFGFNFFSAGGNNLASTTTGGYSSTLTAGSGASGGSSAGSKSVTVSNPLNFLFYSSKFNVGATIQDLADLNVLEILAEPTITTMSGEKANFLAGGEFPFPVVQAGGSTVAATVTVQFRPYGVKLEFTPKVNPDGTIDLKVAPEVSALDFSNAVTIAGYTIPALSTRRAETQMVLQSGQSFAISGLLDQRATDALGHTPGISSVPILGELFKSKNISHSTTELMVIVTPTLVDPLSEAMPGPPLAEPQMIVPMIDPKHFDKELPKSEMKQQ